MLTNRTATKLYGASKGIPEQDGIGNDVPERIWDDMGLSKSPTPAVEVSGGWTRGKWRVSTTFRQNDGSWAVTAPGSRIAFVSFHGEAKRGNG